MREASSEPRAAIATSPESYTAPESANSACSLTEVGARELAAPAENEEGRRVEAACDSAGTWVGTTTKPGHCEDKDGVDGAGKSIHLAHSHQLNHLLQRGFNNGSRAP